MRPVVRREEHTRPSELERGTQTTPAQAELERGTRTTPAQAELGRGTERRPLKRSLDGAPRMRQRARLLKQSLCLSPAARVGDGIVRLGLQSRDWG